MENNENGFHDTQIHFWFQGESCLTNIYMQQTFWFFFSLALKLPWALASDFQFRDRFTDGKTPGVSDWLVARPLPEHRTTKIQNKHIHIPKHPCLLWDSNQRSWLPSELFLTPLGYRDRSFWLLATLINSVIDFVLFNIAVSPTLYILSNVMKSPY
jgi:hypothetical protein